jgi:glucokinase
MAFDTTDQDLLMQITRHRQPVGTASLARKNMEEGEYLHRLKRLEKAGIVRFSAEGKRVGIVETDSRVIALDMGATNTRYMVADLAGNTVATHRDHAASQSPEAALEQVMTRMDELRDTYCAGGALKAIALGVPSAVHPETGLLISANNLDGWGNVAMGEVLSQRFGVPVFLDNDCNMAAVGEYWQGAAVGIGNFVFVAVGTGIGSGIFIDHKLYRGRTGSAGEIYLMNVDWRRWNEDFSETGHVESFASGIGVAEQARQAGLHKRSAKTTELDDRDSRRVFAAMRRGNPLATKVVDEVFTVLGVAVANMISTLDPQLVVLNGGLTKGDPNLLLGTVHKVVHRIHRDVPTIRISALGDRAQLYGSLWTALDSVYASMAAEQGA